MVVKGEMVAGEEGGWEGGARSESLLPVPSQPKSWQAEVLGIGGGSSSPWALVCMCGGRCGTSHRHGEKEIKGRQEGHNKGRWCGGKENGAHPPQVPQTTNMGMNCLMCRCGWVKVAGMWFGWVRVVVLSC